MTDLAQLRLRFWDQLRDVPPLGLNLNAPMGARQKNINPRSPPSPLAGTWPIRPRVTLTHTMTSGAAPRAYPAPPAARRPGGGSVVECGGRLKRLEVRYSHRSAFGDDQLLVLQAPQHAVGVNLGDTERIAQLYLSQGQQVVMIDVPPPTFARTSRKEDARRAHRHRAGLSR